METINIHDAKTYLSRILERVAGGESVIIGRAGKPVAVLSPYRGAYPARKAGSMKGKIRMADDFDAAGAAISDLFEDADNKWGAITEGHCTIRPLTGAIRLSPIDTLRCWHRKRRPRRHPVGRVSTRRDAQIG